MNIIKFLAVFELSVTVSPDRLLIFWQTPVCRKTAVRSARASNKMPRLMCGVAAKLPRAVTDNAPAAKLLHKLLLREFSKFFFLATWLLNVNTVTTDHD